MIFILEAVSVKVVSFAAKSALAFVTVVVISTQSLLGEMIVGVSPFLDAHALKADVVAADG